MTSPVEQTELTITAYKAFDADMKCRSFQYEVGKTYEHKGDVTLCASGFHACTVPFDCWNYYERSTKFARVTLGGASPEREQDSKIVAAKITIDLSLSLPEWIRSQVGAIVDLCKAAKGALVSEEKECAAATGYSGHAAATGYSGHAAATGDGGHAAATGNGGHAAATGNGGHAAATGNRGHAAATGNGGHAAATGNRGHAAATGYSGHAAATGDGGHAAATGYSGHAAATGNGGHAAATGYSGHAAATGKYAIAASLGIKATATAGVDGWIVLAAWRETSTGWEPVAVRTAKVGGPEGVKPGVTYQLTEAGEFAEINEADGAA